jgi:putative transposase
MTELPIEPTAQLYKRHRFPPEIIGHAVWLYFRFPLSLRHVEEMLAVRGIGVSFQTVAEWAGKFGGEYARRIRRMSKGVFADKWHLDEMVVSIKGTNTGCGGPSMQTAMCSTPWCRAGETGKPRCG